LIAATLTVALDGSIDLDYPARNGSKLLLQDTASSKADN
jgi:hypothetical protein